MIRAAGCIFIALIAIAAVSYRSSTSNAPADFVYVNPSGIRTLDPAQMSWNQDFRVALNIWEGLTSWDSQTLRPIAAAAHFPPDISADGRTYRFRIREDARWSSGEPVTAQDFIRGWRRSVEPGTARDYAFLLSRHIDGMQDYVHWRYRNVAALTLLSRLADGKTPAADLLARAQAHPFIADLLANHPFGSDDNLLNLDRDWMREHATLLKEHAAAMNARFSEVGLRAPEPKLLEVRLAAPCGYFLDLTGMPVMLPLHESIESARQSTDGVPLTPEGLVVYDPQWTKGLPHGTGFRTSSPDARQPLLVTNGTYALTDWQFKRSLTLRANPHHRRFHDLSVRSVEMLVMQNIGASIVALDAGRVDFLTSLRVPYDHRLVELARSGKRPDIRICHPLATYFLNFNCTPPEVGGATNPFVDPRVRKAFALAIDRRTLVEDILRRGDRIATSFIPPGIIEGYEPPDVASFNPTEARKLLAAAGFPSGAGLPTIDFLFTAADRRGCQAIAHTWEKELGVTVALRMRESKTFAEDKSSHRFMIARGTWYADYIDPTTFLDCLRSTSGNNDSGYESETFDNLLERAAATTDANERMTILARAERHMLEEDAPITPLLHPADLIAVREGVTGIHPNARLWFPFHEIEVPR